MDLKKILKKHDLWLAGDLGGERADLWGANLWGANLWGANLRRANLRRANLWGANLRRANLRGADLWGANLQGADLWGADLQGADLWGADLRGADLQGADLQGADLWGADLRGADLRGADLRGADLRGADLRGADLRGAKMPFHHFQVVPGGVYWKGIGDVTGDLSNRGYRYKIGLNTIRPSETFSDDQRETCSYPGLHVATRAWVEQNWDHCQYLAKVQIPLDAKINNPWATDGKASVDKLVILEVYNMKTGEYVTEQFRGGEKK